MLTHYLKIAMRILLRMRAYTFINVAGLIISLTGVIVIARYLAQELTVDGYIPQLERTYALFDEKNMYTDGRNWNHWEGFPVVDEDEDLECFTRFTCVPDMAISTDSASLVVRGIAADSMFLKMLPRRVVAGKGAMDDAHDVLVTRRFAERVWPDESAIGKALRVSDNGAAGIVAGVLDEAATKCNFDFEVLVRDDLVRWMYTGWFVCRLKQGADYRDYNARQTRCEEQVLGYGTYVCHFHLQPFAGMYFDRSLFRAPGMPFLLLGNLQNVRILMLVAALLLAVGLFNFLNIYSVVMVHRRRNFAIRKVFGAGWKDIFSLVFIENIMLTSAAVGAAWTATLLVSSVLEKYYGLTQQSSLAFDLWLTFAIIFAFPLVVSAATTVSLWRGAKVHSMDNADSARAIRLRRYVLLVPQMAIAIFLIAVSMYFMAQLRFMLEADAGFRTHDIATFRLLQEGGGSAVSYSAEEYDNHEQRERQQKAVVEEAMSRLGASPLFEHVAMNAFDGRASFFERHDAKTDINIARADEGREVFHPADYLWMPSDLFALYEFELVEGRVWDNVPSFQRKCIITESTKRLLGIKDIGADRLQMDERLWWSVNEDNTQNPPYEIVGVVKDFRRRHMAAADIPTVLVCDCWNAGSGKPIVSFRHEQRAEAVAFIRSLYQEINGGGEPDIEFIEDEVAELYADDTRTTRIYFTFALLAIAVAMLGLFGVVLYDLRRRAREMRIRRVYGARRRDIFRLIARPYVASLAVASVLATPAALLVMRHYQGGYTHHVPITPWYFLLAIAATTIAVLLTIWAKTWQTTKGSVGTLNS